MVEIKIVDGRYLITTTKMILLLNRDQFIAALKAGKAYKRRQALEQRLASAPLRDVTEGEVSGGITP